MRPFEYARLLSCCGLVAISCVLGACVSMGASGSSSDAANFRELGSRDQKTIFSPISSWRPGDAVRSAAGAPGPAYWQNRASYRIDATLDADARHIDATETITYANNSPDELPYLWMSLEQNLFNPASRGARMTPPRARFGNRDGFEGGYELGTIRVTMSGEESVEVPMRVHDTLGRIDLPRALKPGESLTIDLAFSFDLPPYGSDRMGIEEVEQGTIFEIAQWFPSIVKYDDVWGWNALPYLGAGEFYTDFGDYEVALTVPRSHIVAATGELMNPAEVLTDDQQSRLAQARGSRETVMIRSAEEVGDAASRPAGEGPVTWRFKARDVRTFAWASSEAFIWDASAVQDASHATLVQSIYPKEGIEHWSKSTDMLRFAIEGYNERWFEYPYPVATNVNGIVGGMEYPMIIFCRARRAERPLFGVTTHEIGHNWFPMVVSNDERRHAWMDEGFNTFINSFSFADRYPGEQSRRSNTRGFARAMRGENLQPIMTFPDRFAGRRLGMMAYAKPAIGLHLLRRYIIGEERFDDAFRRYIHDWAFKSPQPEDFFRTMENAAGEDLAWFWRGWFYETGTLDQAVEAVTQAADDRSGKARVVFVNHGELVFPLEYRVTYEDGSTKDFRLPVEIWFATNRWTTLVDTDGKTIVGITIDPREILPDVDLENNTWGN